MRNRPTTTRTSLALGALLLGFAAGGCSGGSTAAPTIPTPTPGTGGGGGSVSFQQQISAEILTPRCTGCHTSSFGAPAGGLDLTAAVAYQNLVGAASVGKPGAVRVIAGDPNNSYLVQKLEGAAGIVGVRMPFNGPPYLTDAQIALIRQWIQSGAPKN